MKLSDWLFAPGGKGLLLDDGAIFFFELWHEVMIEKATDLVFLRFYYFNHKTVCHTQTICVLLVLGQR